MFAATEIKTLKYSLEELILSGMIYRDDFLSKISGKVQEDFFELAESRMLVKWTLEHHEKYGEAPKEKIRTVCKVEATDLFVRDRIDSFITKIAENINDSFNIDYVFGKALDFFKKRSLLLAIEETQYLLEKDRVNDAELAYYKYKEIAPDITPHLNPLSDAALYDWWHHSDRELIRMPGYLGEYLSPICRNYLIGILGPPKRGKTTALIEFALIGVMHKLKVVYFNLELEPRKINQKIDMRIVGRPKIKTTPRDVTIPKVDCLKNQNGECVLPFRKGKGDLLDSSGEILPYDKRFDAIHNTCSCCMSDSANKNNFIYAPWFRTVTIPRTTFEQFRAVKNDFKMIFGEDNLIVESYPVGTFSCMDLEKRLKLLEEESGFVADIVLVDYPNVMKMNDKKDLRLAIGDIWKGLASIKQSRNCLVVAASQTNRAAISKADLTMEDLAEDFSKAMISDVFLAINQTPTEKDDKVARISTILHRHRDFSLHKQCRILQVPELGQFCISSHPVSRKL